MLGIIRAFWNSTPSVRKCYHPVGVWTGWEDVIFNKQQSPAIPIWPEWPENLMRRTKAPLLSCWEVKCSVVEVPVITAPSSLLCPSDQAQSAAWNVMVVISVSRIEPLRPPWATRPSCVSHILLILVRVKMKINVCRAVPNIFVLHVFFPTEHRWRNQVRPLLFLTPSNNP